ncbi:hypothetical protein V6N11_040263 [Hibiscus sabdariffa]|uniref:Yippee domain-containing protein n=1 Tax=Hibiscus sabdariffa TaxID=183260 RepID=A0ABR2RH07_9ROSI
MVNNAVTYERNAQTRFFLCRSCHNHVLPGNDIRAVNLSTVIAPPLSFLLLPMFQFLLVFFSFKMRSKIIACVNIFDKTCSPLLLLNQIFSRETLFEFFASSHVMFFRFLPYVRLSSLGQIRVAYHSYPMATMDIHCNVCNTYLGHRRTLHPVLGPGWPNPVMPRRRGSILHLDQLLYWNGTRMIYADTHQPASPNHQ